MLGSLLASALAVAACSGSAATATTPAASAPASVASSPPTNLTIVAKDVAFAPTELGVAAGSELDITFDNKDAGIPHNLALYAGPAFDIELFKSEIATGPVTEKLSIPGLVPGAYQFRCVVHPNMTIALAVSGS
jgi:plastocyanin